jgi:hypothetical protein
MRSIVQRILAAVAICASIAASSHAAPAQGACSLLTRDEVKPFAGGSPVFDMLPPEQEPSGRGTACNYGGGVIYMQIDPFPFSVLDAERTKPGERYEAVPGVGDAAYAHENTRSDDAEIFFRVGQRVGTIQMNIPPGATYESVKPRLIGLARAIAAKLR